jgi:RNA polymerase-binding transcription factor
MYKRRLLELEKRFSNRAVGDAVRGREQTLDSAADAGDASVADESASEDFTEAELDASVLEQIRDALRRIDDGTYGRCLVDGAPIEPQRLDAVPWAAYCIKHQTLREAASPSKPTL